MVHNVFYKTISNSVIRNASCNAFLVMHLVINASCILFYKDSVVFIKPDCREELFCSPCFTDADFPRVSATLGLITNNATFFMWQLGFKLE